MIREYWTVFEPLCREFDRRGVDIVYMTASPDDPALKNPYEHIKGEFIGENNKAFAKLNFLNATLVLSTTPGLDVYQWKRSKKVQYYVHMLHAANEIAGYRMFGTDYYDALLLSGEYQVRDVRYLESIRNLPEKEIVKIGIPYLDEMYARLHKAQNADIKSGKKERTVLLAPCLGEKRNSFKVWREDYRRVNRNGIFDYHSSPPAVFYFRERNAGYFDGKISKFRKTGMES